MAILLVMSIVYQPFLHGSGFASPLPLARFLPPLPAGMVRTCLNQVLPAGSWVLDPITSTPVLALEAARAGYRVLVVSNNPILSFMLEKLAQAPSSSEFRAAISDLAASRRGDERLELHFQSLYLTECPSCGKRIPVSALIWRKDDPTPIKREVACTHCKTEGEFPITAFDIDRLNLPGNPNLHRARAVERISTPDDVIREGATEALLSYLPRPLYFCTTLINKIEGLATTAERRSLLMALALSVCDRANSLWPHPAGRSHPRQLSTPPEFREDNLWLTFENAITDWGNQPGRIPLTHWPELPPETGGICLFSGRMKHILPLPSHVNINRALVVIPRPNQAFWTLSAIWSGWLWGREAVTPLSGALERRRYDWQWHTSALHKVFTALARHLPNGFQVHGLLPELVPGFLAAAVVAGQAAGFALREISLAADQEFSQILWSTTAPGRSSPSSASPQHVIQQAVTHHLTEINEPSQYLPLYTAAITALADNALLPSHQEQLSFDTLSRIQAMISAAFSDPSQFKRYDTRVKNIESGWWWLANPKPIANLPLSDQVEMEIVRHLLKVETCTLDELEAVLSKQFTGLLTPSRELIKECLNSYAEFHSELPGRWQFRTVEQPQARRNDLHAVQVGLGRLGKRLGFLVEGDSPILWRAASGEPALTFYPLVSGIISKAIMNPIGLPERSVLVIPGSRARLISYKIQHNLHLMEKLNKGWRFLKFRLLRDCLTQSDLDEKTFMDLLSSDPPTLEEVTQMRFF